MVRPSPQLQARMRFTTKQVAGGFYRGSRTGAMGSHTEYGGYIIDYRKTRHYVVPDFTDFKLTPFVSLEIKDPGRVREDQKTGEAYKIDRYSGLAFLKEWKENNPQEFEDELDWQINPNRPQVDEQEKPEAWKLKMPSNSTSSKHGQPSRERDKRNKGTTQETIQPNPTEGRDSETAIPPQGRP